MANQGFEVRAETEVIHFETRACPLRIYGRVVSNSKAQDGVSSIGRKEAVTPKGTGGSFVYLGTGLGDMFIETRILKRGLHQDYWEVVYDSYDSKMDVFFIWFKDGSLGEHGSVPSAIFTPPDQTPRVVSPDTTTEEDWKVSEHHEQLKRSSGVRRKPLETGVRAKIKQEDQVKRSHLGNESGILGVPSSAPMKPETADPQKSKQVWVDNQLKRWENVVRSALDADAQRPGTRPANPVIDPPSAVTLVFTLDEGNDGTIGNGYPVSMADLEIAVKRTFTTADTLARVRWMTWEKAQTQAHGLVLVGSHFLQFYHTWMSPNDVAEFTQSRDQHMRLVELGWPDRMAALQAQQSYRNLENANSASTIAKAFWPNIVLETDPPPTTWMRYSPLRIGAVRNQIGFSPPPTEMAFSTNEVRTQMMRGEGTTLSILRIYRDWKKHNEQQGSAIPSQVGRLITSVMPAGYCFMQLSMDGSRVSKSIPEWQNELQKPGGSNWLNFLLRSTWTMDFPAWNIALHGSQLLDCFSSHSPLPAELELDKILLEVVEQKLLSPPVNLGPSSGSQAQVIGAEALPLPPTSDGFVAKGNVSLFGINSLIVQVERWQGTAPTDTLLGAETASAQRVKINRDLCLSSILPCLTGSTFDSIRLTNATFLHQNYVFDRTKAVGWHLDADLAVDSTCGDLYTVLTTALGVKAPVLHLHAGLGLDQTWEQPLNLHSFTLAGVIASSSCQPLTSDWLKLLSIGVRLYGIRGMEYNPKPRSVLQYDFAVFGNMEIKVQRSPLALDYELGALGDSIHILGSLSEDRWKDPLGIPGLSLDDVVFTTRFKLASPWQGLTFNVSAVYYYGDTLVTFTGYHSPDGAFSLTAPLQDFSLSHANDLFKTLIGDTVALPSIDIQIESASANISDKGFVVYLHNVKIAEHTAPDATLTISPTGLSLKGKLSQDTINYMGVQVREAAYNIAIEKTTSTKSTDVAIAGKVRFGQLDFDVAVHLYPSEKATRGIAYSVLAAIEPKGKPMLEIADIVPAARGTTMNLPLSQATFVVASQDNPSLGGMITSGYTFKQGVQLCAMLSGTFESLETLTKTKTPGLILNVKWSPTTSYNLEVMLPTPTTLDLGNGIRTTPFTLGIDPVKMNLILSAGLIVPVVPDPIEFTLSLGITAIDVFGTGRMTGWWRNPFGISKVIAMGEDLALTIGATPAGVLSRLEFGGGIQIGSVVAQFDFKWGLEARNNMLSGELQYLNLTDLADFAGKAIGLAIPKPPDDYLSFATVKMYICPAGNSAAKQPAGFSFSAMMTLFGKKADVECSLGADGIILKGGVDNFELGPYLAVTGANGEPRAAIDCSIGKTSQKTSIDGMVTFFDAGTAIHMEADVLPTPKLDFQLQLHFSDILSFKLNAKVAGAVSFTDLKDTDFIFDAEMDQTILAHINSLLDEVFKNAHRVLENDKGTQKSSPPDRAATTAEHARVKQAWLDKQAAVLLEYNTIVEKCSADLKAHEDQLKTAKSERDQVESSGRAKLESAANENAAQILQCQHAVDNAERELVRSTEEADKALQKVLAEYNRTFGTIQAGLDTAKKQLLDYENTIQNAMSLLAQDVGKTATKGFWKTSEASAARTTVDAHAVAKETAEDNVKKAKAALKSSEYATMQKRVSDARVNAVLAQTEGKARVKEAKATLEAKTAQTAKDLHDAKQAYKAAKAVAEVKVQAVTKSLDETRLANQRLLKAAESSRDNTLEGCTEHHLYKESKARMKAVQLKDRRDHDSVQLIGDVFRGAERASLEIAEQIAKVGANALDIRSVRLSGSLRGLVGADGKLNKPLTAHVEGTLLGVSFSQSLQYKPGNDLEFTHALSNFILVKTKALNELVKDAKKGIGGAVKEVNQQAIETRDQVEKKIKSGRAKVVNQDASKQEIASSEAKVDTGVNKG
ncbi:hypothetical protein FRB96_004108 [Tulasnella sp. 330]|nr:hypothetical protein FRB96_004108 [Tulasnella sp. 330]